MGKVSNFCRQNTTIREINRNRRKKMIQRENLYVFDPTSTITTRTVTDNRALITTSSNRYGHHRPTNNNHNKSAKRRKGGHGKMKNHHTSGREMWRSDTFKFPKQKKMGCLRKLHIVEENARFVLIMVLLLIYLLSGAILFSALENEHEMNEKAEYSQLERQVIRQFCPDLYNLFVANETTTTKQSGNAASLNPKVQQSASNRGPHQSVSSQHWSIVDRTRWAWTTNQTTNNSHSSSPPRGPNSAATVEIVNDCYALLKLLDLRGNLSAAGLMNYRKKWDLPGAFYYTLTLVSTIGYGMTTPRTTWGKVVTIVYGFFGCASCILFFNLFLERIVTLLALILRYAHNFKERFKTRRAGESAARTILSIALNHDIMENLSCSTAQAAADSGPWRPSVYKVFICILLLTLLWMSLAATLYSTMEQWTFLESLYFCFVSFATIGLGDYVSSQGELGVGGGGARAEMFYDIANFIFLSIGCSCIYSLFNVTSIVIRQFLNWTIRNMDFRCKKPKSCRKKKHRYLGLGLRPPTSSNSDSINSDSGSTSEGRPVSLKEFLEQNKISMTVMQEKILIIDHGDEEDEEGEEKGGGGGGGKGGRRGNGNMNEDERGHISADSVGPLAILNHKFGHD